MKKEVVSDQDIYSVILLLCLVSLGFFLYTGHEWFAYISICIGFLGSCFPIARLIYFGWMFFAKTMNWLNTTLLLSLLFLFLLTPLALLQRVIRAKRNSITNKSNQSMFLTVNKSFEKQFFERTW